jgi:hypothetical protein
MKKLMLALLFAFIMSGCYTVTAVDDDNPPHVYGYYSLGYGYYWGMYDPYPWYLHHPHRYYYAPPPRIHVPSYYEKHPEYKTRDIGNTRRQGDTRTVPPPPKREEQKQQPRQQGTRR